MNQVEKFQSFASTVHAIKQRNQHTEVSSHDDLIKMLQGWCENNQPPEGMQTGDIRSFSASISTFIVLSTIVGPIIIGRSKSQSHDELGRPTGQLYEYVCVYCSKETMNVIEMGVMEMEQDPDNVSAIIQWYLGGYDAEMNHWDNYGIRLEKALAAFTKTQKAN